MSDWPAEPEYDSSMPWGGDARNEDVDVNEQYQGYQADGVYIAICAYLVWMIIPGLGLFYGGLARRRSSLSLMFQSFTVCAVVTFQWMFWGYTITYGEDGNPFIGSMANFGLRHVMASPRFSPLPEITYCLYQLMFAAVTGQILIGGAFERGRIVPSLIFIFCWITLVYCVIAHWTWSDEGWLANLPSLDYAGGGPVHIASGWGALAYALVLGKRLPRNDSHISSKPHNTTLVFLGTVLIWFGWYGFNGGSSLNASIRGPYAAFNTNAAATMGALGFCIVDYIKYRGKFSVVGCCEGAIAGLVGITPAAGYVQVWPAALIGLLTGAICSSIHNLNKWVRIDEGLYVFKLHGVGGMVGSFLTGIFADQAVGNLGGAPAPGAWNGNGVQVGLQLVDILAVSGWSFVISLILLYILKFIPGMQLRISEEAEMNGLDLDQFHDEQVGDWSFFHESGHNSGVTHGVHAPNAQGTMTPTNGAPATGPAVTGASSSEESREKAENRV